MIMYLGNTIYMGIPINCCCCWNPGGGVYPYIGYTGMRGPKGYGFSAVLVINRVSIFALWSSIRFFF